MDIIKWIRERKDVLSVNRIGVECGMYSGALHKVLNGASISEDKCLELECYLSKWFVLSDNKGSAPKSNDTCVKKKTEVKKELQSIIDKHEGVPEIIGQNANDAKVIDKKNQIYEFNGVKVKRQWRDGVFYVSEIIK